MYNTFRRILKTSLYYRVKHKSLEMLQSLYTNSCYQSCAELLR